MFGQRFRTPGYQRTWSCQEPCKDFTSLISHTLLSLGWNLIYHHGSGSSLLFCLIESMALFTFKTKMSDIRRYRQSLPLGPWVLALWVRLPVRLVPAAYSLPDSGPLLSASFSFVYFSFGGNVAPGFLTDRATQTPVAPSFLMILKSYRIF